VNAANSGGGGNSLSYLSGQPGSSGLVIVRYSYTV
jgi:hypothetical protein